MSDAKQKGTSSSSSPLSSSSPEESQRGRSPGPVWQTKEQLKAQGKHVGGGKTWDARGGMAYVPPEGREYDNDKPVLEKKKSYERVRRS